MTTHDDIKAVKTAVEANGNLLQVTLGELREALGYNRLGVRVLQEIASALSGEGLGYFPLWVLDANDTPRYENSLRVYKKGSAVGGAIDAVLEPSNVGDDLLRTTAGSEAAEILKSVKALVCE